MFTENSIPQTDDEAKDALRFSKDELVGKNLVGIFQVKRAEGMSVVDAYKYALLAHLEAAGYTFDNNGKMLSSPTTGAQS